VGKGEKEARSISLRVRITPRLLKQLKQLAEENRRTVSNFVAPA
jgi:mRNA-degrading endonuclease RelE of RelBE toxin-antitoxin system